MARMTSGSVEYGETRKIAEFESKKATVALSFTFEDGDTGDDADRIMATIQEECRQRVRVMLGLAKPEPKAAVKKGLPSTLELADAASEVFDAEEPAPKKKPGRPPTKKPPVVAVEEAEEVEETTDEEVEETEEDETEAPKITDEDLLKAIVTANKASEGNQVKTRKLITTYAGEGKKLPQIPQAKRSAFLGELKALSTKKAAAKTVEADEEEID